MNHIDAKGKACPMPVMMAKKEMDTGCEALSITVDNSRTESEPPGGEPGLCRRDRRGERLLYHYHAPHRRAGPGDA